MMIGDYRVVRELGRGGMGVVYLADDPMLDRRVAVKVMNGYRAHPGARARFVVEARAVARINHRNVVTVYRGGEHAGEPYLVSEFVDGTPLDRLPRPLAPERAQAIALDLAGGLAAAHRHGVLHRDVKPGNAIVAHDGTAKLLDFGLARFEHPGDVTPPPDDVAGPPAGEATAEPGPTLDGAGPLLDAARTIDAAPAAAGRRRDRLDPADGVAATLTFTPPAGQTPAETPDLTAAGTRLGTPRYMAPEAWRGERLTAASDVFSLGLVLWELFAGRHPLAGLEGDALAAASSTVPSLGTAGGAGDAGLGAMPAAVRDAIVAVVDRAVAADPAARFADAGALLSALEAACAADRTPAPTPAPEAAARPDRKIVGAAMGGGALVFGALAFVVWPRGEPPRSATTGDPTPSPAAASGAPARTLTTLGGCASEPTFVDGTTLAFTSMRGEDVDIMTLVPGGEPAVAARSPGWDWRASRGRHPGELLFVTDGEDGRERIKALSRATGALTEPLAGYTVATDGETVYYATGDDLGWIHRVDAAGDQRVVQIEGPIDVIAAAPGGAHLAVSVSDPATPPSLCIVELATKAVRCPDTTRMQNGRPAFSADGARLYYASATGLRVIQVAGGADTLVDTEMRASGGIAVAPDGRRLVYSDCRSYGTVVAVGGGKVEVLIERALTRSPAAAPDGALAYVEARREGGTRIMMRRTGEAPRELASSDGELGAPAFTPDGRRFAYADTGATPGIVVRAIDGGAIERWTTNGGDRDPRWLADGSLAFTRVSAESRPGIWRTTAAAAAPTQVLDGAVLQDRDAGRVLAWSPGSLRWVDVATGKITPIALPPALAPSVSAARLLPDGALVLMSNEQSAFLRLDPVTGATTTLHQHPAGQTIGPPTVFADGRIAYRAEIWLGELHERSGAW